MTTATLYFEPFTNEDWFAYSGSEEFPGGETPLTAGFKVVKEGTVLGAVAVLDNAGLYVELHDEVGDDSRSFACCSYPRAARVAMMLRDGMTEANLRALCGAGCL